jgi:hypothetical protein
MNNPCYKNFGEQMIAASTFGGFVSMWTYRYEKAGQFEAKPVLHK